MSAHRDVRPVPCRMLITDGEVDGTLHLPLKALVLDFLNRSEAFFRVTDARITGQRAKLQFFALQRSATLAVMPLPGEPLEDPHAPRTRFARHVLCVLPAGRVLDGTLDVRGVMRVSDFLLKHPGFVALHDATLYTRDTSGGMIAEPGIPEVAVHASLVVGVSEIADG